MRNALELHQAYKRVFETFEGDLVLEDLEHRGCFERSTFSSEPGRTLFNEGRRSMVLHIRHMLDELNFEKLNKEKEL